RHTRNRRVAQLGAPEFLTGGTRLCPVDGALGRMTPENLERSIERYPAEFIHAGRPVASSLRRARLISPQLAEPVEPCRIAA
nr:hypothetical protein [Xanthobacteraceae bacterium]